MQTKPENLTYWALAVRHPSPDRPGYARLDTLFICVHLERIGSQLDQIEKQFLEPGETLLDFIQVSRQVVKRCPQVFIETDGWLDVNHQALKDVGEAS